MKKFMMLGWLMFFVGVAFAEETLNDLLDRRIKLNEGYRDQYAEEAGESEFAKKLQPLEKEVGQAWVDYLKYVKSLKDDKLKEQVLRIEILHELTGCYYDLEYAEGMLEKAKLGGKIKRWERELKLLDKIVGKDEKAPKKAEVGGAKEPKKK